ncbi:Uncharacterised protein [Mycobacteroides abscessus subsp. abscessus]|nr:Uncharacterised protein [Mycobacteroides abscessus subsp. abscessus]
MSPSTFSGDTPTAARPMHAVASVTMSTDSCPSLVQ